MEEDEIQDACSSYILVHRRKNKALVTSQPQEVKLKSAPFNTSRTVVVSAKISRKYSGGVLRGSIPRPRKIGSARGGPFGFWKEP